MARPKNKTDAVRHRKNAAEWVMWVALWPVVMTMVCLKALCRNRFRS